MTPFNHPNRRRFQDSLGQPVHPMAQFHEMVATILDTGVVRPNRTGTPTKYVPGFHLYFDMADGFPAITTKQLAVKGFKGELLSFFRGYTNAADFEKVGCKVWYQNANETKEWLESPYRKGENDLGRIYSAQWTDWRDWREADSEAELNRLLLKGYEIRAHDKERGRWVLRKGINQLEEVLRSLMTNPYNRRMIVSGWRPDEWDQAALPVCHNEYQFLADPENNLLHLCFYQRSFDTGLGFNVALGALMLHIMAKLAGYTPSTMNHFIGDAHVYANHEEGMRTLLSREHLEQPTLQLGASIPTLKSVDEIPGVFARIEPDDIQLINYKHHEKIPLPMAS